MFNYCFENIAHGIFFGNANSMLEKVQFLKIHDIAKNEVAFSD